MLKKRNEKGFTLAELLVVVAIIAILVAIAIPVFSAQTIKAKETADIANLRSIYAQVSVDMISGTSTFDPSDTNAAENFAKLGNNGEGITLNYASKFTIKKGTTSGKITSYALSYDADKAADWKQTLDVYETTT